MTSNALHLSIPTPSKKRKKINPSKMIANLESKTKQNKKSNQTAQTDFAQILLEHPSRTQNALSKTQSSDVKAAKIPTAKSTKIAAKSPNITSTKHLTSSKNPIANHPLTQEKLKIRSKSAQTQRFHQEHLTQALSLQKGEQQRTLKDIQTLAKENKLHLSKLDITIKPQKSQSLSKISQAHSQEISRSQRRSQKLSTPQSQEKITPHLPKTVSKSKHTPTIALEPIANKTNRSALHKSTESLSHKTRITNQKTHSRPQNPLDSKTQMLQQTLQTPQNPSDFNSPQIPQPQQSIFRESALAGLLAQKSQNIEMPIEEKLEEKKGEKPQEIFLSEAKKETQFKITQSRETLTSFTQRLKEEIANYKPPFTKLSMELNPQELGKLEVTITKKGKELQISINTHNPNALQTFIQNQNDFRNTLAHAGFNNIDLNFSHSDSQKQRNHKEEENQKRNKNRLEGLNDLPLANSMEIKMVQYA